MDLFMRTLRDGCGEGAASAPLLLLCDTLAVVGGPALLRQAVGDLAAAISAGRAQAAALTLVALGRPAAHYQQVCSLTAVRLTVLDAFSDPYGWGSLLKTAVSGHTAGNTSTTVMSVPGILAAPDGLQQLHQHLNQVQQAAAGLQQCLVFDSLSPLLDRFGPGSVVQLLQELQESADVSCLLCGVHADLHPPQHLASVEQLAAGILQLQQASELEGSLCAAKHSGGREPQGKLTVRLKRRTGRVRAETQLYCLDGSGGVQMYELPADALSSQAAAERAATAATGAGHADAGGNGLAQQLAGGMKLGLSQSEMEARQRVQLPFEHQGKGAAYQSGDFRDYLPPEAGGRARPPSAAGAAGVREGGVEEGGSGRGELGHILYVRDSSGPDDSDEDPDDDLDI